jgi:hypothetical protein
MAASEYARHKAINVHIDHFCLIISKKLGYVSCDLDNLSSLLNQINIYGSMIRTKYIDFGLVEQPFFDLLLAT